MLTSDLRSVQLLPPRVDWEGPQDIPFTQGAAVEEQQRRILEETAKLVELQGAVETTKEEIASIKALVHAFSGRISALSAADDAASTDDPQWLP